jgi:hypothetical protein
MSAEARAESQSNAKLAAALARLETDGWIERREDAWKTSRRWQQAMARTAVKLYRAGDAGDDLRVPIVLALLETYQNEVNDEGLADLTEVMLPIEAASLGLIPRATTHRPPM